MNEDRLYGGFDGPVVNFRRRYIIRVTLGYAVFAVLWIFMSDALLAAFIDVAHIQWLSTAKGIFFVAVTALMLFFALQGVPGEGSAQPGLSRLELMLSAEPVNKRWVYVCAIVLSISMLLMRSHIAASFSERPLLILFIFPIALSAAVGGFGPGLAATAICAAGTFYYSIPPTRSFSIDHSYDLFQWMFLIGNGFLVSFLCEGLHRSRRQTEAGRQLQEVTLASIGDGVITTDRGGRITFMNPKAEELTGRLCSKASGMPLSTVFRVIDREHRQPLEFPVHKVLTSGEAAQLPAPSILLGPDDREYPVQESGAPIRLADGTIAGVVLVFRDDTQRQRAEMVLQQERSLLKNLILTLPNLVWLKNAQGVYLACNSRFEQFFGATEAEIVGKTDYDFVDHELAEFFRRKDQEAIAKGGSSVNEEVVIFASDGHQEILETIKAPLLDRQGELIGVLGVARDITDARRAEAALRESERRFRDIAEISADWIWEVDEQARYTFASEKVQGILGYSVGEMLGKTPFDFMPPEIVDRVRQAFAGISARRESFRDLYNINLNKNGARLHIVTSGVPIVDQDGVLRGYRGVDRDVTSRRQTEQALLDSERQFRMIVQNSSDIIYTLTATGEFLFVSPAVRHILGYDEHQLTGRPFHTIVHPEDAQTLDAALRRSIEKKTRLPGLEVRVRHSDGEWRWHATRGTAVLDAEGTVLHFQGVSRDITEQRKLEDQLRQAQKMESIGRLAGGVAHDYNNMLSVIIGYSELALEKMRSPDPLRGDLQEILNAALRSADITQQLLAFARKQTIAPKVLDMNETVETALKMLRRLIGEDVHLAWQPAGEAWPVKIDPAQVHQILANLCINARDAIEGVGTITIETRNMSFDEKFCAAHAGFAPGNFVMLAVGDDGSGMDQDTLSHIFEPFFTTKEVGQGTGLGLATVYGIVQQNNGFINVNTEPGSGTTFQIYLPRHLGPSPIDEKKKAAAIPQGHGETILVVEDERAILELIRKMIDGLGYTAITAGSPEVALRLAEQHADEIRLLITDVVMPEMNGKELAARVTSLCNNPVKTLFVSGYTADVIAFRNVLDEGVLFIQKPFSRKDLAEKIRLGLA